MNGTVPAKPYLLRPDVTGIPEAMRRETRWVCWNLVYRAGEKKAWTKVPIDAKTGKPASSTDPATWATIDAAVRCYEAGGVDGIGFVLGDGWVGVDIDSCASKDGSVDSHALEIRDRLNTYGEFSVSGTGLHFITRGSLPAGRRRKDNLEMYDAGRYFTVTGARLGGCMPVIADRMAELAALHADLLADEKPKQKPAQALNGRTPRDADIIRKATESKSGDKFKRLWAGDTSEHDADDSAADLALCSHLAFWTGPDEGAIDRLFRQSGLYRDKWEREDYRARTIGKAIAGCSDYYKWNGNGQATNGKPISADELREFGIDREPGDESENERAVNPFTQAVRGPVAPRITQIDDAEQHATRVEPFIRKSVSALAVNRPSMKPALLDPGLRRGETANIISVSKIGKSWLAYSLSFSFAMELMWLERFATKRSRVLLLDNELHEETLECRLVKVADEMGIKLADCQSHFDYLILRGKSRRNLFELRAELEKLSGEYDVVILDALYRMLPEDASENDNAQMTRLYNELDRLAAMLGAAFICIHHSSKGSQSDKRITDVGAGAGAQSRAADSHFILREHEEAGVVVMEAAVRSFAPVEPLGLRWEWPLWRPCDDIDVAELKGRATPGEEKQQRRDDEADTDILDLCQTWASRSELETKTGWNRQRVNRAIARLLKSKYLEESEDERPGVKKGTKVAVFRKTIHAR